MLGLGGGIEFRVAVLILHSLLAGDTKWGYNGRVKVLERGRFSRVSAGIAQLVEQLICNQ